jgi:tRNA(fMet)-specific endonuclease VapC
MYLLDTNICIYIVNKRPAEIIKKLEDYTLSEIKVSSMICSLPRKP